MVDTSELTTTFFQELELAVLNTDYSTHPALLDRFIAPGFEEINHKGEITRRDDVIIWLLNKAPDLQWLLSEFRIKPVNETVVICIYRAKLSSDSADYCGSQRSSVWCQIDGIWQMLFHQASKG